MSDTGLVVSQARLVKPSSREISTAGGKLIRTTFKTSRLLEFCSKKELVNQTGHPVEQWPLVILKELTDNALDASEDAGTAPIITVTVARDKIVVEDNGPGIPADTVTGMLDFASRTSSNEAYVSPTRTRPRHTGMTRGVWSGSCQLTWPTSGSAAAGARCASL
jgi:hypothetical protein